MIFNLALTSLPAGGNGNPTSLRGTKQSHGLQWTAGIAFSENA